MVARAGESELAGITVFPGTLYPRFAPDIDSYEVELPLGAPAFSLSIAPRSPYAQVHIDGVAMRLTTVPRDTTTRVEVTGPSGETTLVTVHSHPPKQTAYVKATNPDVGDGFGVSVALAADGSAMAVGAPGEDSRSLGSGGDQTNDARIDSGAVYIYRKTREGWRFDGYLKSRLPMHGFGTAVALAPTGKLLAVGEPDDDNGATGSGAVELYERAPRGWRHRALVKAPDHTAGAAFGSSVSLSWDTLAVGSPGEDAAYLYRGRDGFRGGERLAGAPLGERFGETVSLGADGTVAAVSGTVTTRVYGATKGGMREMLTVPGVHGALSGDGTVVAALEPARERVHVYRLREHGWFSTAEIIAPGERLAIDFSGGAVVVGNVIDRFNYRGGARVYRWDGKQWLAGEPLIPANGAANDLAATSIAIDAKAEIVAIGAPGEDGAGSELSGNPATDTLESSGAAYVFQ